MKYLIIILGQMAMFVGGWMLGFGSVMQDWPMALVGGLLMIGGVLVTRKEFQ